MNKTVNREIAMYEIAERIENKFGELEADGYWTAYRRIVYSDLPWISDADIDRLLEQGKQRLAS